MNNARSAAPKKLVCAIYLLLIAATPLAAQHLDYLPKKSFYKTYKKQPVEKDKLAHLPVATDPEIFNEFDYKGRENVLQPLLEAMNSYLDSLNQSDKILPEALPAKGFPNVFLGSSEAENAPPGSEMMRQEHDKFPPLIIYLKKPSKDWKRVLPDALSGNENLLIIRIGFAEYPKANKGIFKKKVVLGTDYEHEIRFLSAEDKPVEVLQLTGMVLNRNGDVLRAGAEGIVHEDTPFWAQVFDIKKSVDDKTVSNLISEFRREDLPGKPLAWKAALDMLLRQLISENK